jgi:hypothetical protein
MVAGRRNVSGKSCRENQNTRFVSDFLSKLFLLGDNHEKIAGPDRPCMVKHG